MRGPSMTISAGVLMALWFVPEAWAAGPMFRWEMLGGAGVLESAAVVAGPACGALLLLLVLSPSPPSLRRAGGAFLGATALALPLFGTATGIPLPVALVLPVAVCLALLAALAAGRGMRAAAHLLLLIAPLATLIPFLLSWAFGHAPIAYLAGLKAPVRIWAAGLAIAASLNRDQ